MDIGQVIKKARLEKGFTQEELAEKVGVQKSAVAKWENGRVSEIKRSNLAGLADALGIRPYELVSVSSDGNKENPEEAANLIADLLLDKDVMSMVRAYSNLNSKKRKQVMEFVHFLDANQ